MNLVALRSFNGWSGNRKNFDSRGVDSIVRDSSLVATSSRSGTDIVRAAPDGANVGTGINVGASSISSIHVTPNSIGAVAVEIIGNTVVSLIQNLHINSGLILTALKKAAREK